MSTEQKITKGRIRSSYIATVVSITLVLFALGLLSLLVLHSREISKHVKENIGFMLILKKDVKDVEVLEIQKTLDAEPYVKATNYIDKDQAAEIMTEELGEDFITVLGDNPLHASLEVKLDAAYANEDSLQWIEQEIIQSGLVHEVSYRKDLVHIMNKRINHISLWMLAVTGLFTLIALVLINSSIRLAIYGKRFVIKTMQLVGAKSSFIRRPFVIQGILHGILSALLAIFSLLGILFFARTKVPELKEFQHFELYGATFLFILAFGILLSWLSTSMAVSKYLRIQTKQLY